MRNDISKSLSQSHTAKLIGKNSNFEIEFLFVAHSTSFALFDFSSISLHFTAYQIAATGRNEYFQETKENDFFILHSAT